MASAVVDVKLFFYKVNITVQSPTKELWVDVPRTPISKDLRARVLAQGCFSRQYEKGSEKSEEDQIVDELQDLVMYGAVPSEEKNEDKRRL